MNPPPLPLTSSSPPPALPPAPRPCYVFTAQHSTTFFLPGTKQLSAASASKTKYLNAIPPSSKLSCSVQCRAMGAWHHTINQHHQTRYAGAELLILVFFLSGLGWYIPGLSRPPTWTTPPSIPCRTIQLFFDSLFRLAFRTNYHQRVRVRVPGPS